MSPSDRTSHTRSALGFPALATVALTLILVASQSVVAIAIVVLDGIPAIIILAIAALAGTWMLPLLRLGPLSRRWKLLLGAGLGIAGLSKLVLGLGLLGYLGRGTWLIILAALTIAAIGALFRLRDPSDAPEPVSRERWLILLVAPFLAMTLLVAVIPPGFLWEEEGGGYDVLEYHLELPKEYFDAGEIFYAPHNVYANFPENIEMLYLLSMIARGDPYDGAATAKILNAGLAMLFVFAAYVAGRETSQRVGLMTAVLASSIGWLTYLSGVAYVENGLLLFAMIALACATRATRSPKQYIAWVALSGLFAGVACGCKYTAAPLVAAPLAVMVVMLNRSTFAVRIRTVAFFSFAVLVGFAPWLIKNTAMTGNPVFPLLSTHFDSQPPGWGTLEAHHFDSSHALAPDESGIADRFRQLWQNVFADPAQRFGPLLFLLPLVRLLSARRSHLDLLLALTAGIQLALWIFATHLYARFAVPMIVPLVVLSGRAFDSWSSAFTRRALTATLLMGVTVSAATMANLYAGHVYHDGQKIPVEGADRFFLAGMGGGHEHLSVINQALRDDAKILMIGDAKAFYFRRQVDYCVVFNRNPFTEIVRTAPDDQAIVDWLGDKGYSHVLVNWAEVARLRNSRYGFPREIQPDLFTRLSHVGLTPLESFATGQPRKPYATLYAINERARRR